MIQIRRRCVKPTPNFMPNIVLASSSPYRRALLEKLQLNFIYDHSHVDESPQPGESAAVLAARLAKAKAEAVAAKYPNSLVIGSDQVAACDDKLLGKPGTAENAFKQLQSQSGRVVRFYTGLCLIDNANNRCLEDMDICAVHFRNLNDEQIARYLEREKPYDCAGSFKSEGYGIVLFDKIVGEDPNALVGLPLIKLVNLLNQCGAGLP